MKLTNHDIHTAVGYLTRVVPKGYTEQDELRQLVTKLELLAKTLPRNWGIYLPVPQDNDTLDLDYENTLRSWT